MVPELLSAPPLRKYTAALLAPVTAIVPELVTVPPLKV